MMRGNFTVSSAVLAILFGGLSASAAAQTRATVSVRLTDALSTASSQVGDSFSGTLASPLVMDSHIVAQEGERVTGRVREVVSSGRLKRPALLTLSIDAVHAPSARYPMQTGDLTIKADSHARNNLLVIGGTTAAGAAIGGAAGGGKGAAIGAAAGAGTGAAVAYLTGKREIVLPAETLLTFHVNSVTISPRELARLQRAAPAPSSEPPVETRTVIVERRHHHGDDDDDYDDDEHEYEHEHYRQEYPRNVEVIFLPEHQARVVIYWQGRTERVIFHGDTVDDILEPLCEREHLTVEVLRPRIHIRHDDDD